MKEANVNNKILITLTVLVALVFVFQVFGVNLTGGAIFSKQRESTVTQRESTVTQRESTVTYGNILNMMSNCKSVPIFNVRGSGGDFLAKGLTPNQYCKKIGYDSCLLVNTRSFETGWNSEDGSCGGGLRYVDDRNEINSPVDCNTVLTKEFSGDYPSGCVTQQNDHISNKIIEDIICCSVPKT